MAMARRALALGMDVRGLDVSPRAAARAREMGVEVICADVCDEIAAAWLCEGSDVVLHTAAIVSEGGLMETLRNVNCGGSRRLAAAAREAGVGRFIHLSSVMVYGFSFADGVAEEGPLSGDGNPYCQTKIESEAAVLESHEPGRTVVTIIRPGDVYGPGSMPWVVRPVDLIKKQLMIVPRGGMMNPVYIDNLIDAVVAVLAADPETVGGRAYNVTDGVAVSFQDFFSRLAAMVGCGPVRAASPALMGALFTGAARLAGLVGMRSLVEGDGVKFLMRPGRYSNDRARAELNFEPAVDLVAGLRTVHEWLRMKGVARD